MKTTPFEVNLIAVFVAVADETSFSKAAKKLGVTKGTVSRGIARLETQLGAELFHRTTHQVALSTAGLALYERAAPHLRALGEAVCKLPEREEEPAGDLKVTAPQDLAGSWLPEVTARFAQRYPTVRVDIQLTNRRVDLVAEGFDVAIRAAGVMKDSSLTMRKLCTMEARVYASPAYVARRGEPKAYGDPAHDWIAFGPAARHFGKLVALPMMVCDDFVFLREILVNGVGVGVLPGFLAEPSVREGRLTQVLKKSSFPQGAFHLLYPARRGQVPKKVRAFCDFLLAEAERLDHE